VGGGGGGVVLTIDADSLAAPSSTAPSGSLIGELVTAMYIACSLTYANMRQTIINTNTARTISAPNPNGDLIMFWKDKLSEIATWEGAGVGFLEAIVGLEEGLRVG
jgi:hypothetical protein